MHNFRDTASVGIIIYDEFDAKNMGRCEKHGKTVAYLRFINIFAFCN